MNYRGFLRNVKLTAENDSIKDELTRFFGPKAVSKLDAHLQSRTNEGES
ncbi:hypothetical protein HanPSC8_Chr01g0009531 [Helianthus annuus]|nr:putative G-box-binding factor [Helianthus annuus]KAJ0782399.1 putative G-box-binding factor [Helianthus annuus]KAJ0956002.1 hypothetical protein HanPSC8_Chr01g0009531 [Helianthus annuus]